MTRSDTNYAAQPLEMARGWIFRSSDVGSRGIVLSSENKGGDELHNYCAADLCLFSHMPKTGFLMTWPI